MAESIVHAGIVSFNIIERLPGQSKRHNRGVAAEKNGPGQPRSDSHSVPPGAVFAVKVIVGRVERIKERQIGKGVERRREGERGEPLGHGVVVRGVRGEPLIIFYPAGEVILPPVFHDTGRRRPEQRGVVFQVAAELVEIVPGIGVKAVGIIFKFAQIVLVAGKVQVHLGLDVVPECLVDARPYPVAVFILAGKAVIEKIVVFLAVEEVPPIECAFGLSGEDIPVFRAHFLAAPGQGLRIERQVAVLGNGPKERQVERDPVAVRIAYRRQQKPAFPLSLGGEAEPGGVEYRDPFDFKLRAADDGLVVQFEFDFPPFESPGRIGSVTGGEHAVDGVVRVLSRLVDFLCRKPVVALTDEYVAVADFSQFVGEIYIDPRRLHHPLGSVHHHVAFGLGPLFLVVDPHQVRGEKPVFLADADVSCNGHHFEVVIDRDQVAPHPVRRVFDFKTELREFLGPCDGMQKKNDQQR